MKKKHATPVDVPGKGICIVAILKGEEPFLDEWLVYHRMLGVDHFFLYDDDPAFRLESFVAPHREYVTVIPWHGMDRDLPGRMNQIKSYIHSVVKFACHFAWVGFIDIDEFVVLRQHESLKVFLAGFSDVSAVSFNWHVFGHCGFYENPTDLITASLIRRMWLPSTQIKTFTRPEAIADIGSPHACGLLYGCHVDANGLDFKMELYPGKTDKACINHYQCRSFKHWMQRVSRGDVNFKPGEAPDTEQWRLSEEACLRQFVTTVALNKNEYVDEFMLGFKDRIEEAINKLGRT